MPHLLTCANVLSYCCSSLPTTQSVAHRLCSGTMPFTCCCSPPGPHVCVWRHKGLLPTGLPRAVHLGSQGTGLGGNSASPSCTPSCTHATLLPFLDSCGGFIGAGGGVPHPRCRSVAMFYHPANPAPPFPTPSTALAAVGTSFSVSIGCQCFGQ